VIASEKRTIKTIKSFVGKKPDEFLTWADVDRYLKAQGSSLAKLVEEVKHESR
jgi:hypothetical protein